MIVHKWRADDQAMHAGEPVTIAGFIDHGEPKPLDEILVEFANGEERTVRRDELTSVFDVIEGHWQNRSDRAPRRDVATRPIPRAGVPAGARG